MTSLNPFCVMQRYHALGIADQFGNIGSCNALFKENSCEGVSESMWRGFLFERTRKIKDLPQPRVAPDIA